MSKHDKEWAEGYESYGQTIDGEPSNSFWEGWEQAKFDREDWEYKNGMFEEEVTGER